MLHTNLALVRTATVADLDALFDRAELRRRLVRRVAPDAALVPRSALPLVRQRLAETATPCRRGVPGPTAPGTGS